MPVIRNSPPARSEVAALVNELSSAGVTVPPITERALSLVDRVERLAVPPDITAAVADMDLSTVTEVALMNTWRRSVTQLQLSTPAGRSLLRELMEALVACAVAELAEHRQEIVDELLAPQRTEEPYRAVERAHAAGLSSGSDAHAAIARGPDAVAAWRDAQPAVRELDKLYRLRTRLLLTVGAPIPDDELQPPRWIDRVTPMEVPA